eukprot:gene652-biopygen16658
MPFISSATVRHVNAKHAVLDHASVHVVTAVHVPSCDHTRAALRGIVYGAPCAHARLVTSKQVLLASHIGYAGPYKVISLGLQDCWCTLRALYGPWQGPQSGCPEVRPPRPGRPAAWTPGRPAGDPRGPPCVQLMEKSAVCLGREWYVQTHCTMRCGRGAGPRTPPCGVRYAWAPKPPHSPPAWSWHTRLSSRGGRAGGRRAPDNSTSPCHDINGAVLEHGDADFSSGASLCDPAQSQGGQEGGAGVARAWRGRGAGYRLRLGMSGAGVARAWRGHFLFPQ